MITNARLHPRASLDFENGEVITEPATTTEPLHLNIYFPISLPMITSADLPIFIIESAAIIVDYILGLVLFSKTVKLPPSSLRKYYIGVFGFFATHSMCRTVFFIRSYFLDGSPSLVRDIMSEVGAMLGLVCVLVLVVVIEMWVFPRSRKIFTILGLIGLGVMMVGLIARLEIPPESLVLWVHFIVTPVLVAFIILIYLRALLKATGSVRTNALVMLMAIVMLSLSELGNSKIAAQLILGVNFIGPTLMAASLIMLYFAVVHLSIWKKAEHLRKEGGTTPLGVLPEGSLQNP